MSTLSTLRRLGHVALTALLLAGTAQAAASAQLATTCEGLIAGAQDMQRALVIKALQANQLASMDRFSDAVGAYESFLRTYPQAEDHAHIQLWTGLIYSRYLDDPQKAIERIEGALPRLVAARDLDLARSELERLRSGRPVV